MIGDGNTSLSTAAVHYQCPYDFATVWEYDPETSTLKISGNGPMMDLQDTSAPWYIFKDQITTVVIKEGITEIGAYTFKDIINLNRMYIPVSLSRFNEYALANDQLLLDITMQEQKNSGVILLLKPEMISFSRMCLQFITIVRI